ncbi:serine/threonine protein kinase [Pendulispora albinea]|uniref:non-specific serine/threonine protein kinase n=1 Tax=Pendulispora albinea TaxID=2741071 RepID=A0ABZ2LQL2_9BACT
MAKIASGGMANVYLGRARPRDSGEHPDKADNGVDHMVAIKVPLHELSQDDQGIKMFLDEAKILSRLSHPNLIRTVGYGTTGDYHFIAMELLVGRTLMDVWDTCAGLKVAMRLDMSAWIIARVAEGLHYAHELTDSSGSSLGIIHRDVNPSNIFLTYAGEIKLFDFGLAKSVGRSSKSQAGIVKGKLPYLSPEQILQMPIDRRSDLFTLGTTLWEMTTMRRLFRRENDIATVKAVRSAPIPDPRTVVRGYPDELANIVIRALDREPDRRYATAADLGRELDAFVKRTSKGVDMSALTPAMLDRLFPGDRARQVGWLRRRTTPPPLEPVVEKQRPVKRKSP